MAILLVFAMVNHTPSSPRNPFMSQRLRKLVLEDLINPSASTQLDLLEGADDFLARVSDIVTGIIFPHREENPLPIRELHKSLNQKLNDALSYDEFLELLDSLFSKEHLSGIAFDGYEMHILEEHYRWKTNLNKQNKIKVGRVAARFVKSGDKIAIDAGSATDELVNVLCNRFKSKSLHNVKIVTNSLSASTMLLNLADSCGFGEHDCPYEIHIVGGMIRPNTRAVVTIEEEGVSGAFLNALRILGGADVGFVGVNGIHPDVGFTTHINREARNKRDIISLSKDVLILGDTSKINLVEDEAFATFDDQVSFVVDHSAVSEKLEARVRNKNATIIMV